MNLDKFDDPALTILPVLLIPAPILCLCYRLLILYFGFKKFLKPLHHAISYIFPILS